MQTRSAVVADGVQARSSKPDRAGWPAAAGVALAYVLLVLPLLGRTEWEDDMEHLTVATAIELRWTGHVMTPTLQGETRLNKPPLMPWLTAACVSEQTLRDIQSTDESVRRAGRARLAFEARLPAHIMSALLLLAVYGLGRVVVDARCGLRAAVACATMFLFARYMRFETFDAPLALFAALAQLCLAYWVFDNRRWVGAIGGGLALGLGVLSKGPVILLFAAAPLLVYLPLAARWMGRSNDEDDDPDVADPPARSRGPWLMPVLVLIVLAIVPILPWVFAVVSEAPGAWSRWVAEVTRKGTTATPSGKWYTYAEVVRLALPWTPWVIAGGVLAVLDWRRGREVGRRAALLLAWVIVPIVVMSLARDRKPHYLLPLVAPLAVLAGRALGEFGRPSPRDRRNDLGVVIVVTLHWLSLIGLVLSVWLDRRADAWGAWTNRRWPELLCMTAAVAGVAAGVLLARRSRVGLITATVAVVFATRWLEAVRPPFVPSDRAAMRAIADEIWRVAPAADVYIHDTSGGAALAVQRGAELQVLMGRIVRWTPNPPPSPATRPASSTKPATTDAAIFVVHRTKKATTRPFDAPGWTVLDRQAADKYPVTYELLVPADSAAAANAGDADPSGD